MLAIACGTLRVSCFINGKIKKETKNLAIDINVAKNGQFHVFRGKQQIPWQTANSTVQRENPPAVEYFWP